MIKLGLEFNYDGSEAWLVDLEHNDTPRIFKICIGESDYPKNTLIQIAREVRDVYNKTTEFLNL